MFCFSHTARGIGQPCNSSIQCEAETPYSTCDTDKKCRCHLGYLELNKSCSPGIILIYRDVFCLSYAIEVKMHLECKCSILFYQGDN